MRCCAPRSPTPRARLGELEENAGSDPLTGLADARELARELERAGEPGRPPRHAGRLDLASISRTSSRSTSAMAASPATPRSRHVARLLKSLIRASDVAARNGAGFALLLDHLDRRFRDRHRRADRPLHRRPAARSRPAAEVGARGHGRRRHHPARRHRRGSPPPRRPQPRARQGILTASPASGERAGRGGADSRAPDSLAASSRSSSPLLSARGKRRWLSDPSDNSARSRSGPRPARRRSAGRSGSRAR